MGGTLGIRILDSVFILLTLLSPGRTAFFFFFFFLSEEPFSFPLGPFLCPERPFSTSILIGFIIIILPLGCFFSLAIYSSQCR